MSRLLALAAAAAVLALLAVPGEARAEIDTVIVIGDQLIPCRILRHDEKSFTILDRATNAVVPIEWAKLDPQEARRIKKLLAAADAEAEARKVGRQIDGVEVRLASGMVWVGVELADRQTGTHRFFTFPRVPLMAIPVGDIKEVRPCKVYEGEIYSLEERYRMKLATVAPQSAADFFALAEWCRENGLPAAAEENLVRACLLDPGFDERCKAKREALEKLKGDCAALRIYHQVLVDKAHCRYVQALKGIEALAKEYPDFPRNAELAAEAPAIRARHEKLLRREVVGLWYMYMLHLVEKCAQERVSETPPVPAKLVTLTNGFQVQGRLVAESPEEITLEALGQTYKIDRKRIARIEQRMIENGPWRERTLAECRKYVTDPKNGISADILAAVTRDLGIADKEAREIWDQRLADPIVVKGSGLEEPELAVAFHEARWSVGSWLRGAGGAGGPGAKGPQWKDEETWWKEQPSGLKAEVLGAMCAEALTHVEKVYAEPCVNCGGTGRIEVLPMTGGGRSAYPCPVCRGSGKFFVVTYR